MKKDFLIVGDRFWYNVKGSYYQYIVIENSNNKKVLFPIEKDSPMLNLSNIEDDKITIIYLDKKNRYYRYYKMIEDIAPKIEGYNSINLPDKLYRICTEVTEQMCDTRLPENEADEENMIKVFCRTEIDRMLVRQYN